MTQIAKPVLLTVDDDPGVSRAVARDLRRRYGEQYRVVRAESVPGPVQDRLEQRGRVRGPPQGLVQDAAEQ